MARETLLKLWDEFWETGLWAAPLSRAVEDLTAQQAAWKPDLPPGQAGARHTIWQIVHHIIYWREVAVRRTMGGPAPSPEESTSRNFDAPRPDDPREATSGNWQMTREKLAQSHSLVRGAIADESLSYERFPYVLAHDCYHVGQIMTLRAMQGLRAIE